jgi:hypothetical protein
MLCLNCLLRDFTFLDFLAFKVAVRYPNVPIDSNASVIIDPNNNLLEIQDEFVGPGKTLSCAITQRAKYGGNKEVHFADVMLTFSNPTHALHATIMINKLEHQYHQQHHHHHQQQQ